MIIFAFQTKQLIEEKKIKKNGFIYSSRKNIL